MALGVCYKLSPDEAVTREQMVTFFARYAAKNGVTVSDGAELSAFKDGAQVSSYAAEAMAWAVKHGIVNGIGAALLDPQGTATRVQAAAIVQRLRLARSKLIYHSAPSFVPNGTARIRNS